MQQLEFETKTHNGTIASVGYVSDSVTHHFGIPKGALRRKPTRLTHPTWLPG